jgi:hypothetical protein
MLPQTSDFSPNIWASSPEVTPVFFLSVSVSIGMLRAVTSDLGKSFPAALTVRLSKGSHLMILNILPNLQRLDMHSLSDNV